MRHGSRCRKGSRARNVGIGAVLALVGAMPAPAAASAADEVATFQANPAHDGFSRAVGPTVPLALDWKRELGERVSYPLVADGRVFVVATGIDDGTGPLYGATLYALDVTSGETLWSRWVPDMSSPTYDSGRVIISSAPFGYFYTGVYDAATGKILAVSDRGSGPAPVASNGRVFGEHGAIDVSDGRLLWEAAAGRSMVAVDADSYYSADTCGRVRRIDTTDGHQAWAAHTGCSGGGGNVAPVLHNGELWARNIGIEKRDLIFDAETGATRGEFSSVEAPAFAGDTVLLVDNAGTLRARDLTTQVDKWAFAGKLRGPPLIVGSVVYAISADAHLYALDLQTGAVLWDQDHDGGFYSEFGEVDPSGLAVADGRLFAPMNGDLYAYGNTGGGLDPGEPPNPGAGAEVANLPPLGSPTESIGYRGNPAHSGFINSSAPAPPVRPLWTYGDVKEWESRRDPVIAPLVTGGKLVYFDRGPEDAGEAAVHALDAHTGLSVWSYPGGGPVAVNGNSVFALARDRTLTSLDLDTGRVKWRATVSHSEARPSFAPQAADGVVYVHAGGRLEAYRGSDGSRLWSTQVGSITDGSLPALDAEKVYVECQAPVYRATGQKASTTRISGCEREAVALGAGVVETGGFAQSATDGRLVDLTTGGSIRAGNLVLRWRPAELRLERADTGERLWQTLLPQEIPSPPLIVGRYLYVPTEPSGTSRGELRTFDLATGVQVDQLTLPGRWPSTSRDDFGGPPSMTAADGLLFVPNGYGVIALATQGALLDTEITSGPAGETYETSASFGFTGTGGATGFECSLDRAAFGSCTSPAALGPLQPGAHVFEVRAIAPGRTDSTPARRDFTVLESASTPELETEILSGPTGETAETRHEFAFSASQPGATFECSLDAADFSPCTSPTSVGPLAPGPHTFQVRSVLETHVDPSPASREFLVAGAQETDLPEVPEEHPPAAPMASPPSPGPEGAPPTLLPGLSDLAAQAPAAYVRTVTLARQSGTDFVLRLEVRGFQAGRGDAVIVRGQGKSSHAVAARMHSGSINNWWVSRRTSNGAQLIDRLVRGVSKRGSAKLRAGVVGPASGELERFRITGFGRAGAAAT